MLRWIGSGEALKGAWAPICLAIFSYLLWFVFDGGHIIFIEKNLYEHFQLLSSVSYLSNEIVVISIFILANFIGKFVFYKLVHHLHA